MHHAITLLMNVADNIATAVLLLLVALSVASVGIAVERLAYFSRRRIDATTLGRTLAAKLAGQDRAGAVALLEKSPAVEATVMREALAWIDRGPDAVREVIEGTLREQKREYERGLLYLGTLGNNAPFVGLFGTVLGIVSAFRELGAAGNSGQMGNVMGGIAEALVATAIGILVAIPAVVAFNYFQKRAGEVEENVATLSNYLFAHLKGVPQVSLHGAGAVSTDLERPTHVAHTERV